MFTRHLSRGKLVKISFYKYFSYIIGSLFEWFRGKKLHLTMPFSNHFKLTNSIGKKLAILLGVCSAKEPQCTVVWNQVELNGLTSTQLSSKLEQLKAATTRATLILFNQLEAKTFGMSHYKNTTKTRMLWIFSYKVGKYTCEPYTLKILCRWVTRSRLFYSLQLWIVLKPSIFVQTYIDDGLI